MRLFREQITMPTGLSPVSGSTNIGQEKLVGVHLVEVGTGLTKLVVQCLVSGNQGDAASEVWQDVELAATDNPPALGYVFEPLGIATAEIVDGKVYLFPRANAAYTPPVIRLRGEGTLATNAALFRFITDPHS